MPFSFMSLSLMITILQKYYVYIEKICTREYSWFYWTSNEHTNEREYLIPCIIRRNLTPAKILVCKRNLFIPQFCHTCTTKILLLKRKKYVNLLRNMLSLGQAKFFDSFIFVYSFEYLFLIQREQINFLFPLLY